MKTAFAVMAIGVVGMVLAGCNETVPVVLNQVPATAGGPTLHLTVQDEAGKPLPFRAELWRGDNRVLQIWNDKGSAGLTASAGKYNLVVKHGFAYQGIDVPIELASGHVEAVVTLKKRFDAQAAGYYCGESHLHGMHGPTDSKASFAEGARMAAADGLDFLQIGFAWEPTFAWVPSKTLDLWAKAVSTDKLLVNWNIESPKCYMTKDDGGKTGNLHCFGHGWTFNLKNNDKPKAFWFTGPNYLVMQEIHRQGGVVGLCHPIRFWFNDNGNFVANWASEMPFDFVAGVPYVGVDILNDTPLVFFESERVWWNLLNAGYKVAATGDTDGSIMGAEFGLGQFRTYIRTGEGFDWDKGTQALKDGATVATSGPFAFFEVSGKGPGAEFVADGKKHKATITAYPGPSAGETLTSVAVIRNGEIVRAWDLRDKKLAKWSGSFQISDKEFAWYAVRVISQSKDRQTRKFWGPSVYELASTSAIWMLPPGYQRPKPAKARTTLTVVDAEGKPVSANVTVVDNEKNIATVEAKDGSAVIESPATALLTISAPGFKQATRSLYMDTEIYTMCRKMSPVNWGPQYPSFFSPETFKDIRNKLANLEMKVVLEGQ